MKEPTATTLQHSRQKHLSKFKHRLNLHRNKILLRFESIVEKTSVDSKPCIINKNIHRKLVALYG